ncbi:MAG: MFS transporter, partial [Chloroflexi bacterium]|nr:MFS transporter [Chloroflexota bacterium]
MPGSARLPNGLRALRHRNFRLFWTGQLISLVGTWMQQVAQGWLVLELTGDPLILGAVAAAQFTPVIILGLFAGVFADAFPKRAILMATQIASAVLALVLGLLVATGTVEVWHVFVLASLLGVANAFDMPVRQAFVVEMVGR